MLMLEYYFIIFFGTIFSWLTYRQSSLLYAYIFFYFLFFLVFIGLRYEVGADWFNYLEYNQLSSEGGWIESLVIGDPGYVLLNRLSNEVGGGVYLVNTFAASILLYSVILFSKHSSLPGLVLYLSIPNLLIVIGMGYTRQSIAVGFEIIALTFALHSRFKWAFFYLSIATLFHKSAIILFPIFMIGFNFVGFGLVLFSIAVAASLYLTLASQFETLYTLYVAEQLGSSGAFVRTLFNAIPALLFFLERRFIDDVNYRFWFVISSISLGALFFVNSYPVAVDRIVIYLFPIQLYIWTNYVKFVSRNFKPLVFFGLLGIYALSLIVWLNFGVHSDMWVPYRSFMFVG